MAGMEGCDGSTFVAHISVFRKFDSDSHVSDLRQREVTSNQPLTGLSALGLSLTTVQRDNRKHVIFNPDSSQGNTREPGRQHNTYTQH